MKSAMVLLFLGLEWIAGVAFFLTSSELLRLKPIIRAHRKILRLSKKRHLRLEKLAAMKIDGPETLLYKENAKRERRRDRLQRAFAALVVGIMVIVFGWAVVYEKNEPFEKIAIATKHRKKFDAGQTFEKIPEDVQRSRLIGVFRNI